MNKFKILTVGIIILLSISSCSNGIKSKQVVFAHPNFSENNKKQVKKAQQVFNTHFSQCKKEAYASVPYPSNSSSSSYTLSPKSQPKSYGIYNTYGSRVGTLKPESTYGVAPDFSSIARGYIAARNSPSNIYKNLINKFTSACIRTKGWKRK